MELQDLNVLIGPNGSGKSNFLEVFEVLKSLPSNEEASNNLPQIITRSGGILEWCWKGDGNSFTDIYFETFTRNTINPKYQIQHIFKISVEPWGFGIEEEHLNHMEVQDGSPQPLYSKERSTVFQIWNSTKKKLEEQKIDTPFDLSILSQRTNSFPLHSLALDYEKIRLYREWSFGRNTIFRTPQRADQRNDRLESDFSNLGMFLYRLRKDPVTKRALIVGLQDLYEGLTDFEVLTEGGTVQIFFTEGDFSIPATRLSDGSLRYLCLLAILLDPTPPPLICIEEPELGLHPDIMPKIADLLIDASKRTQLVVTTHSDVLIDALSEQPESVLVCEKHEGQTQIKRLNKEDIAHWLKDYRLGQLWTRGEIGGTRW
ncbi:MAG TPA: AAA family ATPase [Smithellaceae bacterium]|nr:AAA family ATPase [Smithellaceae bacterium]